MALYRTGDGTQISGSTGGVTYSHNRFGQYRRARSIPVNPLSAGQVQIRGFMSNISVAWSQTLTAGQRLAWEVYAAAVPWTNALGAAVRLTGINMFNRTNVLRLQAGLTRLDTAPAVLEVAQVPTVFTPTGDVSDNLISVAFANTDGWAGEVGGEMMIFQGLPQNVGRTFFNGPWKFLGKIAGAVMPPTSPQTFAPVWTALALLQRDWVYCRAVRADGRVSSRVVAQFLPVA